ncbi:MAG: DUF1304 domain-containing protein [Pseudomonadota bacterium]
MAYVATGLIGLNALIHLYILWMEMFAWEARGPVVFDGLFPDGAPDMFAATASMAANQGLYNGFLAAGLIWALTIRDGLWRRKVATCFLYFVAVAGLYGAVTVTPTTLIVQTLPAALALGALWVNRRSAAN